MASGLDSVTDFLNDAGSFGDKLNAAVGKANGWTALSGLAGAGEAPRAPSSASAGASAAPAAPRGVMDAFRALPGVVLLGIGAFVGLVIWSIAGR